MWKWLTFVRNIRLDIFISRESSFSSLITIIADVQIQIDFCFPNGLILNLEVFLYGAIYLGAWKLCKLYAHLKLWKIFILFFNLWALFRKRGEKNSKIDIKELLLTYKEIFCCSKKHKWDVANMCHAQFQMMPPASRPFACKGFAVLATQYKWSGGHWTDSQQSSKFFCNMRPSEFCV